MRRPFVLSSKDFCTIKIKAVLFFLFFLGVSEAFSKNRCEIPNCNEDPKEIKVLMETKSKFSGLAARSPFMPTQSDGVPPEKTSAITLIGIMSERENTKFRIRAPSLSPNDKSGFATEWVEFPNDTNLSGKPVRVGEYYIISGDAQKEEVIACVEGKEVTIKLKSAKIQSASASISNPPTNGQNTSAPAIADQESKQRQALKELTFVEVPGGISVTSSPLHAASPWQETGEEARDKVGRFLNAVPGGDIEGLKRLKKEDIDQVEKMTVIEGLPTSDPDLRIPRVRFIQLRNGKILKTDTYYNIFESN